MKLKAKTKGEVGRAFSPHVIISTTFSWFALSSFLFYYPQLLFPLLLTLLLCVPQSLSPVPLQCSHMFCLGLTVSVVYHLLLHYSLFLQISSMPTSTPLFLLICRPLQVFKALSNVVYRNMSLPMAGGLE